MASALAAVRAFNIARQPVDLWPVQGLVRPTIPLVPSAQGIGPFPCMCRHSDADPAVLFPGGLRHGQPDGVAAVSNRHLRMGDLEAEDLFGAPASQLVLRRP